MENQSLSLTLPPVLNQSTVPKLIRNGAFSSLTPGATLCVEASALCQCDGAGVAFLWTLQEHVTALGGSIVWQSLPDGVGRQLEAYRRACEVAEGDCEARGVKMPKMGLITALGRWVCEGVATWGAAIVQFGWRRQ